jgi:hypothetical protein
MIKTSVIDISEWQFQPYAAVPIGKRVKNVVINPSNNCEYYFKEPENKYPWEHWTEIAASKIGLYFGFNVLDYNVGISNNRVGCISLSMVDEEDELIHGQQLLTQIRPKFEKKKGTDHTFQLIDEVFKNNNSINSTFGDFLKMLVFDSIIGNRDRHQQNWGFIRSVKIFVKKEKLNAQDLKYQGVWGFIKSIFQGKDEISQILKRVSVEDTYTFTPFFDNGNCLAYNITNDSIALFLNNDLKLNNYLFGNKATSHVKWESVSLPHCELLKNIMKVYPNGITTIVRECIEKYNEEEVNAIIYSLDEHFDNERHGIYGLSLQRKELMAKLVKMRVEKLAELIA